MATTQFRFHFENPDDREFFEPLVEALAESSSWAAIARLMTIVSIWESLMRLPDVRRTFEAARAKTIRGG